MILFLYQKEPKYSVLSRGYFQYDSKWKKGCILILLAKLFLLGKKLLHASLKFSVGYGQIHNALAAQLMYWDPTRSAFVY